MAEQHRKRQATESIQAYDLLRKHHRFLRDSDGDDDSSEDSPREPSA
jgi:hypothetical protein